MEKLKTDNGMVSFLLITPTGATVSSTMREGEALELIQNGKVERKDGEITVDKKFVFRTEDWKPKETVEAVPAVEDKPLKEAVKDDKPITKKPRKKAKKK